MSTETNNGLQPWIPFLAKLIWPFFVVVFLLIYHAEVGVMVSEVVKRTKSGAPVSIAGILSLGQAADDTAIGMIGPSNFNIEALGGPSGIVRKGSSDYLERLQADLEENPNLAIDTLLLVDGTIFSIELLREYVATLGLRYVIFTSAGEFDGWMNSSVLMAQLPSDRDEYNYDELRSAIKGIREDFVTSDTSTREVLLEMQKLHISALPVLDAQRQWKFFVDQGQILSRLMTGLLVETEPS